METPKTLTSETKQQQPNNNSIEPQGVDTARPHATFLRSTHARDFEAKSFDWRVGRAVGRSVPCARQLEKAAASPARAVAAPSDAHRP
jgi:hypothetical protein